MKAQDKYFNYEARYSDRYIQYLEKLSEDDSKYNTTNISIAKETLSNMHSVREHNKELRMKRMIENEQ